MFYATLNMRVSPGEYRDYKLAEKPTLDDALKTLAKIPFRQFTFTVYESVRGENEEMHHVPCISGEMFNH